MPSWILIKQVSKLCADAAHQRILTEITFVGQSKRKLNGLWIMHQEYLVTQ